MVNYRDEVDLDFILEKVNNMCKHMALPYVRIKDAEIKDNFIYFFINGIDEPIRVSLSENIKYMIHSVQEYLDWQSTVVISNVSNIETDLDLDNLPKNIKIIGLPYRQLKIRKDDKSVIFVDLCQKSYQRVYDLLYKVGEEELHRYLQNESSEIIDFKDFKNCLKRKELLVLLLSLT